MTTPKLRISSLDKDVLKANFISWLQQTSEFQNFNPTASGWATFLDLMAYNAYYQSLMSNFLINETFIDTASKRQNVVSRASELGYTPASKRAAKATVQMNVSNVTGNPSSLVIPAGTTFSTTVGSSSYTFTTIIPYSANLTTDAQNNIYYPFTMDIYEGMLTQNSYILDSSATVDVINMDIDTTSLRVFVTLNVTEYEFYPPNNFLSVKPTDYVYYLSEMFNSYRIYFGNNTFGYLPPIGSGVRLLYLVTSGSVANGAGVFTFSGSIPGAPSAITSISTVSVSAGGSDIESIDDIKTNAKNYFRTQDRAVIEDDYKSFILQASSNIKDVLVWGGQKNNPPIYGAVVACVQPLYGDYLTSFDQQNITSIINAKSVPNMDIVFVNPTYLNLVLNTNVVYDSNIITSSAYDLQILVQTNISNYVKTNLSKFNGSLNYSQLVSMINTLDTSILSNTTTIYLKYEYIPTLYQNSSISFSFKNQLDNNNKQYTIKSTIFYISGQNSGVWFEDDNAGNLNIFYSNNGIKTYAGYNIGTVNYVTGDVQINSLNIVSYNGTSIDFVTTPLIGDISCVNEVIINLNDADITVFTQANTQG